MIRWLAGWLGARRRRRELRRFEADRAQLRAELERFRPMYEALPRAERRYLDREARRRVRGRVRADRRASGQ